MKRIAGVGLILILVLVAVLLGVVLTAVFPLSRPQPPQRPPPLPPGDFELFYTAKTVISIVNIVLLISLMVIYSNLYRKVKSKFTLGLVMVMLVLLLYALTSNPLLQTLFGFQAFGLGPFAMLPDIFATAALVVLLYLSLE
jgi:hypothetical protein